MNRIILIGNGFDLAHGLKTSYKHFIDVYWKNKIDKINEAIQNNNNEFRDDDIYFNIKNSPQLQKPVTFDNLMNYLDLSDIYADSFKVGKGFSNTLLKNITAKSLINWVDVEEEYYRLLKSIIPQKNISNSSGIIKLNFDFSNINQELEKYLSNLFIFLKLKPIKRIKDIIYAPFDLRDITEAGIEDIVNREYAKIQNYGKFDPDDLKLSKKTIPYVENFQHYFTKDEFKQELLVSYIQKKAFDLVPSKILFLNFNYTNLEKLYTRNKNVSVEVNHIHGELNNKDNPIIFGYGDELGEEYAQIEKLNDNNYLENIKSIRYLETDNYKNLLRFVESESYQIFIFGHSCGLSDRTLLNTLFEHENCVSIKPFYYINEKEINNYNDIIKNISRNFNNKVLMRDRVVNKTYCKSLI